MYIHAATEQTFADHRAAVAHLFRVTQPNGKALNPDSTDIAAQLAANGYFPYAAPTIEPWQTRGAMVVGSTYTHAVVDRVVETECCCAIDHAADAARLRLVSPGQWVDQEYLLAFEDATAFKAAGYTGEVPGGVSTWAIAEGWTDQQAADDIIYQKALWKAASDQIRGIRLAGKASCRAAATAAAKWTAMQSAITQLNALFV